MLAIIDVVLPVFGLIAIGAVAAWRGWLDAAVTDGLNRYVVWLALPSLLFAGTAKMRYADLARPGFVAAAVGGMLATLILALLLERASGKRFSDAVIDAVSGSYSNNGYLGTPLLFGLFGQAVLPAFVISILSTVLLFGVAIVLIEFDLAAEPNLGRTLRTAGFALARNPLLLAPLAGLAWAATAVPLPAPVDRFVTLLADSAGPCALVTIGLFLAQQESRGFGSDVVRLTVLKLFVQPLFTFAIAWWARVPTPWFEAALLLAALPTGTGPFMIAKLYDRDAATTSRTILLSTLVSVLTVSALILAFGRPVHG